MSSKPNHVLLTSINSNANAENNLRKQRMMVSVAISAWDKGGDCYERNNHIQGHCEQQKEYFVEALTIIDKHLKKFN